MLLSQGKLLHNRKIESQNIFEVPQVAKDLILTEVGFKNIKKEGFI